MLNYETYCRIHDNLGRQSLTHAQTAQALGLDVRTVSKWAEVEQFAPRAYNTPRVSKLDAFKGQIVRWLDTHPYSAQQIYQRLREAGYEGGRTIVKDYGSAFARAQRKHFSNLTSHRLRPPKSTGVK